MANSEDTTKYRVLILGGCGFIGRHLVDYLVTNNLVSKVRVVDKVPPQTAWLNKYHQEIFSKPSVEFRSANLINTVSCQNAFADEEPFDFVINLAAETKMGQSDPGEVVGMWQSGMSCRAIGRRLQVHHTTNLRLMKRYGSTGNVNRQVGSESPPSLTNEEAREVIAVSVLDPFLSSKQIKDKLQLHVYKEGIVKLSNNCAKEAAKQKVKKYIEISSGHIHSSEKTPVKESAKLEPWTVMARFKLQVEEDLATIPGLNYVILRPAIVYGIGDKNGIMPRLVVGAVYKHLGEMMKLLWHKDIKMYTVHVLDMCRAIWHACLHGKSGEIYHIVDKGNTTQGKISEIVSDIFNINHDYFGTAMSTLAKVDMSSLVDDINDKHLGPWAEACSKDGIENTPLNPYLHQELLYDKHLNLDGSKFETTGFSYLVPEFSKEKIQEIVNDYITMGIFPRSLIM